MTLWLRARLFIRYCAFQWFAKLGNDLSTYDFFFCFFFRQLICILKKYNSYAMTLFVDVLRLVVLKHKRTKLDKIQRSFLMLCACFKKFSSRYSYKILNCSVRNKLNVFYSSRIKDALHLHSQPKVQYDENFTTAQHDKNLKKKIILKISRALLLHYNNTKKLLTN